LTNISREMKEKLETVQTLMTEINKLVPEKYGQVSTALENIAKQRRTHGRGHTEDSGIKRRL
jgi:ABC-type phosphate transport system auxiliary subunit